jgi:hypothetical protein
MDKKKTAAISIVCIVLAAGAYFAVHQLGKSKKTVNVSVNELIEEKKETAGQTQEEALVKEQENNIQEESKSIIQEPVKSKQEEKKAVEQQKPVTEDKSASNDGAGKIVQKLVSWGFTKSSGRKIDTIIVHTSYNSLGGDEYDADKIIDTYKQYNVSAHYLILRDGTIYQLVADQNISWHAGVSEMPDGRKNVNDFSIGIEVINTKDGKFADDQYSALNSLISSLKNKYAIKYVLGHDDIAPGRKTDPWGIEWGKVKK